jgi:hypothetical protein
MYINIFNDFFLSFPNLVFFSKYQVWCSIEENLVVIWRHVLLRLVYMEIVDKYIEEHKLWYSIISLVGLPRKIKDKMGVNWFHITTFTEKLTFAAIYTVFFHILIEGKYTKKWRFSIGSIFSLKSFKIILIIGEWGMFIELKTLTKSCVKWIKKNLYYM